MKKIVTALLCSLLLACGSETGGGPSGGGEPKELSERNLVRAMDMVDKAVASYFTGQNMAMSRYYNPFTEVRSAELGSIWMYTSSIEAVNAILHALKAHKDHGKADLYDDNYERYTQLLAKLYDAADFYKGTFQLTSYTQTKSWTVYGVNRGAGKGAANVEGRENVYDDQMWLVREFLEAYKLTGTEEYLQAAEYLTEYVMDGWDCYLDAQGNEYGGITWGPGYVTKHSCSNGPMVSPLVWLYELYKDKNDQITYRYIASDRRTRTTATVKKSDYYLKYAKATYAWQKKYLLRQDGVYDDMMGNDDTGGQVAYETVDGTRYRKHSNLSARVGPAISYNSGTMLSGAADLYRATGDNVYLEDARKLATASFGYFAKLGTTVDGLYTYGISGFNNWFNGVMMRGYVDVYPNYETSADYIDSFQKNLDYAYEHFVHNGFLPTNLLVGWSIEAGNNKVEGMFTFAFAAEYAVLARHELEK